MFDPIGKHLDVTSKPDSEPSLQVFESSEPGDDELFVIEETDVIVRVMALDYGDKVRKFIIDTEAVDVTVLHA